jgi:heat shock protein HtpX
VAIAQTAMPNAFAVGRSPKTATVCATTGILDLLTPVELEGVLGHELTHVQNRDVMVMTIASFFASIASFIVQIGFWFGGAFDDEREGGALSFMAVVLISALVYVVSWLLLQALSRYREFAADRGSAIITGRPSALISALLKISGTMEHVPQRDLRAAQGEMAAFYIVPPKAKATIASLFSTHPPLEARIAALQRFEAQLQGTA